ncbi:MAG: YbaK/EbsC family protein [Candidatus Bathyarchaeota archaeon]|nr:MAG: YbaK/EbsC family protein [Candidatus Bathyarchaeota archaeon]
MASADLRKHLDKMGVSARFFRFEEHTMTVDAAINRLGVSRRRIIKSMVFVDDDGLPVLGIVTGNKRVSEKKLANVCKAKKVKRANSAQVKEFTGYNVGAVPPVGHKTRIRTFIDQKVMSFDKVIGGGGQINQLLEISPAEIQRLTMGKVIDISE